MSAAKLAAAALILGVLLWRMDMAALRQVLVKAWVRREWLAAGVGLFLLCLFGGVVRWRMLLAARGIILPWRKAAPIYFVGHFFNSFMLGTTGGDFARVWYAAREVRGRTHEIVASVILDRAIGLCAIVALGVGMVFARSRFFLSHPVLRLAGGAMLALALLTAAAGLILLNISRIRRPAFLYRTPRLARATGFVAGVYRAMTMYKGKRVILRVFFLSLVLHVLVILECRLLGLAFQIPVAFLDYLTVVPIILCLSCIPITPSGLGLREGLAVAVFGALGVPQTQSLPLSLSVYFIALFWSLVGGVVFAGRLLFSSRPGAGDLERIRDKALGEDGHLQVPGAHQ